MATYRRLALPRTDSSEPFRHSSVAQLPAVSVDLGFCILCSEHKARKNFLRNSRRPNVCRLCKVCLMQLSSFLCLTSGKQKLLDAASNQSPVPSAQQLPTSSQASARQAQYPQTPLKPTPASLSLAKILVQMQPFKYRRRRYTSTNLTPSPSSSSNGTENQQNKSVFPSVFPYQGP
jgi:hypothetical protein